MKSIDICVCDFCNNKCIMCTNPDRPWPAWDGSFEYDYDSIIKRIEERKSEIKQCDSIYLTGGEPTIHPQFHDLLHYLAKNFPQQKIKLLTNGRKFIYKDFAKKTLAIAKNIEIELSLYGHNPSVHDRVTRTKNSFTQTTSGLRNLLYYRKESQIVNIRAVITKLSFKKIGNIIDLIENNFSAINTLIIIFHEIEAQAKKNKDIITIKYSDLAPYLNKCYPKFKKFGDIRLYHFPLCALDKKFRPYARKTLPENEVKFLAVCRNCHLRSDCVGIHKGYLEINGTGEFNTITN